MVSTNGSAEKYKITGFTLENWQNQFDLFNQIGGYFIVLCQVIK